MSYERKDGGPTSANNNGYPSTAYNGSTAAQVNVKGVELGNTGEKDTYEAVWYIDFANADTKPTTSEDDNQIVTLPAFGVVKSVDVSVLETVSGGTNFTLGLSQPDGSVIDADGLVTASTVTAVGTYVSGSGALVGASVGAAEGQLTLTTTRTAGKIKVLVQYIKYDN